MKILRTRISGKRVVHYLESGAVNIIHVGKPLRARIVYAAELRVRKAR
jgi:hypothetical protein